MNWALRNRINETETETIFEQINLLLIHESFVSHHENERVNNTINNNNRISFYSTALYCLEYSVGDGGGDSD